MDLTVLGCAGTFPGPDSPCSGYLLEAEGFKLLVDVGNGVLGNLQRCTGLLEVDAVLVSHLHADHLVDLVPWAYARKYHPYEKPSRIPVIGPQGALERLVALFDGPPETVDEVYDVRRAAPGRMELGPFTVDLAHMEHPVETFAMRVGQGDTAITYSADTGPCPELVDLARGSDALLCEASFLEGEPNPPKVHLTGKQAAEHAARAGVGQLLLTHIVPWHDPERSMEEASAVFTDGELGLVAPCMKYRI